MNHSKLGLPWFGLNMQAVSWQLFVLLILMLPLSKSFAHELSITIKDSSKSTGIVYLELHHSADSFTDAIDWTEATIVSSHKIELSEHVGEIKVTGLIAGWYAARVYLDENNNNELDLSVTGIPKEAVGFSNNPLLFGGAPSLEESAFTLTETQEISISLIKQKRKRKFKKR